MTGSNQLIEIKKETCIEDIIEKGFLQETKRYSSKILVLRLPIKIKIKGDIFKKYEKEFTGAEEKGGLLIFIAQNIGKEKILELIDIKFLRNESDNPTDEYKISKQELKLALRYIEKTTYIPFTFHTHTIKNELDRFIQADVSEADGLDMENITLNGRYVSVPDMVIILHDGYRFTGSYGGNVLPLDFNEEKGRNVRRIFKGIINFPDTGNKRLILSGVAVLGLTCFILYPQTTISVLFGLAMSTPYISIDQEREYFNYGFNDSDTVILLPEKNIDESPKSEIENGVNVDYLFKITSEKIFWIVVIVFMTIILVHMIKE